MCGRRNKPFFQALFVFVLIGGLGYGLFSYNELSHKFTRSERQVRKYAKHQESLTSQLQVVYEHRARLEKSLQREKSDHKQTKQTLELKQHLFRKNFTRTKHEAMNRFSSLDTQFKMLKAKHDDIQGEYSRLQQQHARLSSDQAEIRNQLRKQLQAVKEQRTNEIASLEEHIKTMAAQISSLKSEVNMHKNMASKYKSLHHNLYQEREDQKLNVISLRQKLASQQRLLNEYNERFNSQSSERRSQKQDKLDQQDREEVRKPNRSMLRPSILPSDVNEQLPSLNKQVTLRSPITEDEAQLRINPDSASVHTVLPSVNSVLPQKDSGREQNMDAVNEEVEKDPNVQKYLHQKPIRPSQAMKRALQEGYRRSRHERDLRDVDRLGFHGKPIPKPVYLKDSEVSKTADENDDRDEDKTETESDEMHLQQEGGDDEPEREKDTRTYNANQRSNEAARVANINSHEQQNQYDLQMTRTMPNEMNAGQVRVGENNQENRDNEEYSPNGEDVNPGKRILKERTLKDFRKG